MHVISSTITNSPGGNDCTYTVFFFFPQPLKDAPVILLAAKGPLKSGLAKPPQATEVFLCPMESHLYLAEFKLLFSFCVCVLQQQTKTVIEYECFEKPQPH